jgi:hypothetical protein
MVEELREKGHKKKGEFEWNNGGTKEDWGNENIFPKD